MQPVQNKGLKGTMDSGNNGMQAKFPFNLQLVTKLCIILAVLSCLVYANTLKNDYVIDDVMMITENKYVKQGFEGIPVLLSTHHLEGFGSNAVSDYYRPLSLVFFAVEYELFGLNPAAGHFFNILFFAACVVLLFLFLNRLFDGEKTVVAFVASLLFAVHPIHTEVVANIKSRDEIMCFFFAFIALHIFMNYVRKGKLYLWFAGVFCLFLAVLSKETMVTFMGVVPLVFFFYKNEHKKRSILVTIGTVAVVALFLFLWNYVQTRSEIQESLGEKLLSSSSVNAPGHASKLAPKILILGYHLRLLFVPYPLNFNYSFRSFAFAGFGDWEVLLSFAAYLFLISVGVWRIFRYKKDPWAFGILFYLVTLSLYSNIVFVLGQAMANRYAFFPSVGFCFLFALAFEKWILRTTSNDVMVLKAAKPLSLLVAVLLGYSIVTIARNADWRDNATLVSADLPKSPDDYMMQYKAGLELQVKYETETNPAMQQQLNEQSIEHFKRSLAINPGYTEAHSDIAVAYLRMQNFDSAAFHFKRTLELNPMHFNAAVNLGTLFLKQQMFSDAIVYYRKALVIDTTAGNAWYNMGICFAQVKQLDSSLRCIKKVIEIAPALNNYKAFGHAATLYEMMGNMDSARKYEQLAKQYYPDFRLKSSVK